MEPVTINELTKIYTEIGVLGMISVVTIFVFIGGALYIINNNKKNQELITKVLENEQSQNKRLVDEIVNRVITHVPSAEENETLTKMQTLINDELKSLLISLRASRVALVQYHNGGHSINKQSFLKMSVTNESFQIEESPLMPHLRDQFRTIFSEGMKLLDKNGEFIVDDLEKLKNVDNSMYSFMRERGDEQAFHIALHDADGMVIGYLLVLYSIRNKNRGTADDVMPKMKQTAGIIEKLITAK